MPDFRKLDVWNKSIDLTVEIYTLTKTYPKEELFVLVSQIRRCCISISSNIAEGSSNRSKADYKRYLTIALGSSFELESQILISFRLKYISENDYNFIYERINHIQRMLQNLIKSII